MTPVSLATSSGSPAPILGSKTPGLSLSPLLIYETNLSFTLFGTEELALLRIRMALGGPGWTPRHCLLAVCPKFSWPFSLFASSQLRHGLRISSTKFFSSFGFGRLPLSRAMVRSMGTVGFSSGNSPPFSSTIVISFAVSICH